MDWNYLSIPKLQQCNRWSLGMDKKFHPTLCWACDYLSMLVLKLNHVSKRGYSSHHLIAILGWRDKVVMRLCKTAYLSQQNIWTAFAYVKPLVKWTKMFCISCCYLYCIRVALVWCWSTDDHGVLMGYGMALRREGMDSVAGTIGKNKVVYYELEIVWYSIK